MISMLKNKTVSVILPNYNYAKYIAKRIDEVLAQTYPVSEIIVLDDASTDGSQEIIEKEIARIKERHPEFNIKCEYNQQNSGNPFSQWQKGIQLATSDYIWICELDDSAKPTLLKTAMAAFDDEKVVLSYCNSRIVGNNGKPLLKDNLRRVKDAFRKKHSAGSYIVDGLEEINNNLAVYNSIPNVSAAVFRKQPDLIKYLDQAKQYRLCGDWYFYLMIASTGKIAYSSRVLNYHRVHQKSVTGSTSLSDRFAETKEIHQFVKNNFTINDSTIERINKIEANLAKKWKIKDN